ncbi:MAG TPA: hypothetical protein VK791_05330 [bacterium]|jgi:hypothetical protein|nr:hypothetical protein [bacterium]
MKKFLNCLTILTLMTAVSLMGAMNAQAGPSVKELSETNLMSYPSSPFHLQTDRYKEAFQTIGAYLSSHDELSNSTILIADNHGHFLRGVVTDWSYYTFGTHKGIELYVYNPEDGSQFLTVEVWLPKEQQRNIEKKESYVTSFQEIENFLTGSQKYRLDLVFQDEVQLAWGKGYSFKLDDEGISLSFTVNSAAHPKVKVHEVKEKPAMTAMATPIAKGTVTPQATASTTPSMTTTPTTSKKKKKSKKSSTSSSAAPTAVPTAVAASDDSR